MMSKKLTNIKAKITADECSRNVLHKRSQKRLVMEILAGSATISLWSATDIT